MKALLRRWSRIWTALPMPSVLRWRINGWVNPDEVFLFKLLYRVNHHEQMWPCMVPQIAYFGADFEVLNVEPGDWEPATTEIHPPETARFTTFYVDWPDGQVILIADRDGKVSRLMTNEMAGTATMEIGIHDGPYIDSLGTFVSVTRHDPTEE